MTAEASAGPAAEDGRPFTAYREQVRPEWLDYNGHLNDASYAIVLTRAHELLLENLGLSAAYRESHQASMFTVEMHLRYVAEVNAGRLLVGHPFNPPYLIPLVEVCGGERTDPDAVKWADEFYTVAGKRSLKMDQEVSGFVGNRVQEALWREALHMVDSGQATVQQIDDSIAHGPGLRWAIMGPMLTFHLAGGQGGMGHMLDHFGPALLEPWTRLEAPELTAELRDRVVAGAVAEAGGRSVSELERRRDAFLVDLLLLLERHRDVDV
jgi:hypothetical protein